MRNRSTVVVIANVAPRREPGADINPLDGRGHRFKVTNTGEPHARRRAELFARYPGIRALSGYDRRTAWVTVGVVVAQFAIAWWIGWHARTGSVIGRWWVVLPVSYAIGAPLTHWLSTAIHETAHRLALRTKLGNALLALLANLPMFVPVALTIHRYHLDHHKLLDVLDEDTDLPHRLEARHIGNSTPRKFVWVLFNSLVYMARGATFAKRPNAGEIVNIAIVLAVDAAVYGLLGPAAAAYLALSFFFGHGLHPVAAHFLHEHYTFAAGQETYSYYGPLNWITFNVGYHNEHHDFMFIPGWRLPELRRLVPEYGELVSHSSWTKVLWRFVTDRGMGYASRIVRSRQDFERGRSALAQQKRTTTCS
jgi:sphingolipid 4-desaturase/C4-monooxygenase